MNDNLHPMLRDFFSNLFEMHTGKPAPESTLAPADPTTSKMEAVRSGFPEGWDRDESKAGTIFRDHRCTRCNDGAKPCPDGQTGPSRNCEHPHARND